MKHTLKELRLESGMTQREVANHLDVTVTTVSIWENSDKLPSNAVIYALSALYNVDVRQIKKV